MTAEWIAARRELLNAATEGPWSATYGPGELPRVWTDAPEFEGAEHIAEFRFETDVQEAEFVADARTSLPRALDALEAVLALAKGHRDFVTKRGRDDYICTICDMCRAIEATLRGAP